MSQSAEEEVATFAGLFQAVYLAACRAGTFLKKLVDVYAFGGSLYLEDESMAGRLARKLDSPRAPSSNESGFHKAGPCEY